MKTPDDSFVYEIQLCTSSFMTSVLWLRYHLHFVQVGLITLYMFGENLSPSNVCDVVQNNAVLESGIWDGEGEEGMKEEICACVQYMCVFAPVFVNFCCIPVDHSDFGLRSSDMS